MTEIKKNSNVSTFEKMLNLQTLIKKESAFIFNIISFKFYKIYFCKLTFLKISFKLYNSL